jgi:hypothetical protein
MVCKASLLVFYGHAHNDDTHSVGYDQSVQQTVPILEFYVTETLQFGHLARPVVLGDPHVGNLKKFVTHSFDNSFVYKYEPSCS